MPEADPVDRFIELKIAGFEVMDIEFVLGMKAVISLDDGALMFANPEAGDVGHHFELQFNRIIDGSFEATGDPWFGTVASHTAYRSSAYLKESLKRRRHGIEDQEKFYHFEVVFDQGHLKIIAGGFAHTLLQTSTIIRDFKRK